jgi:hypothetical protein
VDLVDEPVVDTESAMELAEGDGLILDRGTVF